MAREPQTPAAQQISRRLSAWPGSATWLVLQRDVEPLSSASSLPKWGMLVNRASQPQNTTVAVSRLVSTAYITVCESDAGPTPPPTRA
ncbi:hypothetical protein BOO86_25750 [Mycobacterium sp. CBMA 234]|uniref:hypothetical protein n=1 Tax=Mycolicibacterium sp. CBMA 234 TaxID=1918495 RepID=UPI0012DF5915|nr:hypothetical protein [Mycolicibacterium sp. CBMA 234]MUL67902.1 hypothetical protein [Mycolicibacterium sp. CBMA 234]